MYWCLYRISIIAVRKELTKKALVAAKEKLDAQSNKKQGEDYWTSRGMAPEKRLWEGVTWEFLLKKIDESGILEKTSSNGASCSY